MRPYEVMIILESSLEESAVQAVINRSSDLLQGAGATVNRVDKWGRRRLAYEIDKRTEGFYVLLEVTSEPGPVDTLDNNLGLADEVVRHKIVRVPEHTAGRARPSLPAEEPVSAGPSRGRRGEGRDDA